MPADGALAPAWHTRALLALLLLVPFTSLLGGRSAGATSGPTSRLLGGYLPSVLVSCALAGYVARFGLPRSILQPLLGRTWDSKRRAFEDLTLAAVLALVISALDAALTRVLLSPESLAGHALLPVTTGERAAWVVFAVAAGAGEELLYRGYLQTQLAASCQSRAWGLVLQALLFGIAHGEHGGDVVARFAGYALLLGGLTLARGSLLPAIVAHVGLDLYAGLAP